MTSTAPSSASAPHDRQGLLAGLACYGVWGFLPILFGAAERSGAGVLEIVAWRTIISAPLALGLVLWADRAAGLKTLLLNPKDLLALLLSAALIAVNWITYVWAVDTGHTITASLGYYINPLLNMAAGALLFREKIDRSGMAAIALALVGVVIQGLALGEFPWISLILAFSFAGYGIVRKQARADAQTGLLVECVILAVPAAVFAVVSELQHKAVFGHSAAPTLLLILCGPATVVPLALFAFAARRLPLTIVGFLQFIAPTIQFAIGLAQGEAMTPLRALSFVFIWGGVAVFAWGAVARSRAMRTAALQPKQA